MSDQDQIASRRTLADQSPNHLHLLRFTASITEKRVQWRPRFNPAKCKAGGLQTSAPPTREYTTDRDSAHPKGRPNAASLLSARRRQVPLRGAIVEPETQRVPHPGIGRGVTHHDDLPPALHQRPERLTADSHSRLAEQKACQSKRASKGRCRARRRHVTNDPATL